VILFYQYVTIKNKKVIMMKVLVLTIVLMAMVFTFSNAGAEEIGMNITGVVTHNDWTHMANVDPNPYMPYSQFWGWYGVHDIVDRMKAAGMKRLYWRIFDGGEVYHNSTLDEDSNGVIDVIVKSAYKSTYDYDPTKFGVGKDSLSCAIEYAHSQGIEVYAWLSICEENHYGGGLLSRFASQHQEYCEVDRSGRTWEARLSFSFADVRAYKLSVIREVINDYNVDGVFLDFARGGMLDSNVQAGYAVADGSNVSIFGYDSFLRSGYQAEYGVDPYSVSNSTDNWIQYRCDNSWTQFLRDIKAEFPDVPLVPMIFEPSAAYTRKISLLDWQTWLSDGLVDGICFLLNNTYDGLMYGGDWNLWPNPASSGATIVAARKQEVAGRADVIAGVYSYWITAEEAEEQSYYVYAGGADELMWWETGTIVWADYTGSVTDVVTESSVIYAPTQTLSIDENDSVTIAWKGLRDKIYSLYYTDDLSSGWLPVPGQSDILSTASIMQWVDTDTTAVKRFYCIESIDTDSPSPPPPPPPPPPGEPEVHYLFDEISGSTADDSSANNRDGAVYDSSTPQWVVGYVGNCLYFDGIIDNGTNVSVGGSLPAGPSQITIQAWVKLEEKDHDGGYDVAWEGSYIYMRIGTSRCVEGMIFDEGNCWAYGSTPIPLNTWTHVAMVYDGSGSTRTIRVYLNGVEDGAGSYTGRSGIIGGGPYNFIVGRNNWGLSWSEEREFTGWIDDFSITYGIAEFE
jgi:concanavalin A-like lectin/glucanase superfamily protein/glycosyl hydrolase family 10